MGFRNGAYAKVWEVTPVKDTLTRLRISTNRKNKQTGEYEQDFSGFVACVGSVTAAMAAGLKEGARIKIEDCEVTTKYDKGRNITYTNFTIFKLEDGNSDAPKATPVDDGEVEVDVEDRKLPF